MANQLDQFRTQAAQAIRDQGLAIFYGLSRLMDSLPMVHWDVTQHPSVDEFLETAKQAGARMIVVHEREFLPEHLEDAMDQLEEANPSPSERAEFERRIKALRRHEGELCMVELSFDLGNRIYVFTAQTDWYEDLTDLMDELESMIDEQGPDSGMTGFFSPN